MQGTSVLSWIQTWLLPGAVLLGIVIFVHELGHFLAAKARGVRVLRFSLGFGPALFSFRRGETEYRISVFPLGGYVQMAGDTPEEDGHMPDRRDEFLSHPWPGRVLIAVAGPLANLITAFAVMVSACLVGISSPDAPSVLGPVAPGGAAWRAGLRQGDRVVGLQGHPVRTFQQLIALLPDQKSQETLALDIEHAGRRTRIEVPAARRDEVLKGLQPVPDPPVVGGVQTGMPAYQAGVKEGDRILAVNGKPVNVWTDLPDALHGQVDHNVVLTILRNGQTFAITVKPIDAEGKRDGTNARIGIEAPHHGTYVQHYNLLESLDLGARSTVALVGSVYGGMWTTLMRPLYYRQYLGGPLFIAQAASEQAKRGVDAFLQFLAMINIAIMAFNLLPIPMLDGGHILLALVQAVRGHGISARGYMRFQKVGLVVIGALFVFIIYNDPRRLIQRHQAIDRAVPQGRVVAPSPP